jgi:hypothetical protein
VDERVRAIYEKKYEHIAEPSTSVGKEDEGKGELWLVKLPPGSLLEDFDGVTVRIHSDADRKKSDENSEKSLNVDCEFAIAPNEIGRFEANKANAVDDEDEDDDDDDASINRRYRIVQSEDDGVKALRAVYVREGDTKEAFKNAERITKRVHLLRAGFKRGNLEKADVVEAGEDEEDEGDKKQRKKETKSKKAPASTMKATTKKSRKK